MGYKSHPPPAELLIGYDPVRDLPKDHLCRLVEHVVEAAMEPKHSLITPGQPRYDPRMLHKVQRERKNKTVMHCRAL